MSARCALLLGLFLCRSLTIPATTRAAEPVGYYRQPAIHGDTIVFVAEGDLWRVSAAGGRASRLTTHLGDEEQPAISPDGNTLAFTARYEGATEVYTMPLAGGRPVRRTYDGAGRIPFVGWTRDGKVLFATHVHSTLPALQLVALDVSPADHAGERTIVPLAEAADGDYDGAGQTLFFTRQEFQGSHTKRYRGGTAQQLWKFAAGAAEAVPLTADYAGTSKRPMWFAGRVYFASDRDGTLNLWSMAEDGSDLKQHTRHAGWDVASPSLGGGRIVYQLGADLHVFEIATGDDRAVAISLDSDFDQTRQRWVNDPWEYVTSWHAAADGERVVLTARGRVFVAPRRAGRLVEVGPRAGARCRDARFLSDGASLVALSDESGEVELWRLPANGVGESEQLTRDGEVLRTALAVAPTGKHVAYVDKNQRLFLYGWENREQRPIDESPLEAPTDLRFSPDGQWLAYVTMAPNQFRQIKLYGVADGQRGVLTSDRYDSFSPAFSPDGKRLYFLSDRHLQSQVKSPWGRYQPEPYFDRRTKIYHLALVAGERSPFAERDELRPKPAPPKPDAQPAQQPPGPPAVRVELDGIAQRLEEVPVPPGNYSQLAAGEKGLFWLSTAPGEKKGTLQSLAIDDDKAEVKTVAAEVTNFELCSDGKKLVLRKGNALHAIDASPAPATLEKTEVNLAGWTMAVSPQEEWRGMFREAWRLERDYFYDRGMHGVDWPAMREKYGPLVERVRSRSELSDLLAQMTSELSALHIFVRGGDHRHGSDDVLPGSLGAVLARDPAAGGYRVTRIYQTDPDEPSAAGPLARPGVAAAVGDVIEAVNGRSTLSAADVGELLRNAAGRQTLLRLKPATGGPARDVVVTPIAPDAAAELRYADWELSRRQLVEHEANGQIGYVHLRAMGQPDIAQWARDFYPVFTRAGLIVDVRRNQGGNIDSWIVGRLLRKAWFYWSQRVGRQPNWNMQYAFRGHLVVLCDAWTASDGEAFTEGVKRLGLGKVIGTRTWGGEIWLSMDNVLADKGIASAAEYGVFGPEGQWLIEGHGVEPDVVVDNLPHATFKGQDAQLAAAIEYLKRRIAEAPVELPPPPPAPNKSLPPAAAR